MSIDPLTMDKHDDFLINNSFWNHELYNFDKWNWSHHIQSSGKMLLNHQPEKFGLFWEDSPYINHPMMSRHFHQNQYPGDSQHSQMLHGNFANICPKQINETCDQRNWRNTYHTCSIWWEQQTWRLAGTTPIYGWFSPAINIDIIH